MDRAGELFVYFDRVSAFGVLDGVVQVELSANELHPMEAPTLGGSRPSGWGPPSPCRLRARGSLDRWRPEAPAPGVQGWGPTSAAA